MGFTHRQLFQKHMAPTSDAPLALEIKSAESFTGLLCPGDRIAGKPTGFALDADLVIGHRTCGSRPGGVPLLAMKLMRCG